MNENEFNLKYSLEKNSNLILTKMTKKLREVRPKVPKSLNYTIFDTGGFAQIWLKTVGCRFSKIGSCTCCDYWEGEKVNDLVEVFKEALLELNPMVTGILLETSGSVLDENEISMEELKKILELINKKCFNKVIIETHIHTITKEKLDLIKSVLKDTEVCIEVGIESLNREVLKYSLNKMSITTTDMVQLCEIVHESGCKLIGNVMLGVPFLSMKDQIQDAVNSIQKLFKQGIDYIILFPVNIKQYTLVYWLYQNDLFDRVYGQTVLNVLNQVDPKYLDKIDVVWYGNRKQENPGYDLDIIGPYYCKECNDYMMDFFLTFDKEENLDTRITLLHHINDRNCECKCKVAQILHDEFVQDDDFFDRIDVMYHKVLSLSNQKD